MLLKEKIFVSFNRLWEKFYFVCPDMKGARLLKHTLKK